MIRRVFLSGAAASTFLMLSHAQANAHQRDNRQGGLDPDQIVGPATVSERAQRLRVGNWTGHVVVHADTVLTRDIAVESLTVAAGATLTLHPLSNVTVESRGNVIVEGTLSMQPASAGIHHTITFVDVDESAMLGSTAAHSGPIPQDVGLWVTGNGTLRLDGAPKVAWCRSAGAITAGQSTFTADAELHGWRVGDEVVITPTGRTERDSHRSTVTAVEGRTFTLANPTPKAHPSVDVWGTVYGAELLNLTRNVKIQGTPQGRAHTVFLHCHRPQHVSYVEYAHLGPMGPTPGKVTNPFPHLPLGRWAFHFHHGGDDVAGSTVEGVVCRDIGTFAFVPHLAHGIAFTDCVAHNVGISAYWWDDTHAVALAAGIPSSNRMTGDSTNGATFTRCVASHIQDAPAWDGTPARVAIKTGFLMGEGVDNAAFDCVASGVVTFWLSNSGGFSWQSNHSGEWATNGSLAHNSTRGIDLWNNNQKDVIIHEGMTQYHCDLPVRDGAYITVFGWTDLDILGQYYSVAGKRTRGDKWATAPRPDIVRLRVDADGRAPYAFYASQHHSNFLKEESPLIVSVGDSEFKGGTVACVGFTRGGNGLAHIYEFIDPVFHGNEFWLTDDCPALSVITWKRTAQADVVLHPKLFTGDTSRMRWNPQWNAWSA